MTYHKLNREKEVEGYLVRRMEETGYKVYKFIPDQRVGMPDRIVVLPEGKCIWVETKTSGGNLSEIQKLRHMELKDHGQRVEVVWDKKDVDALVRNIAENL